MNKRWFIHTGQVETRGGGGAFGDGLTTSVTHTGFLDGGVKLIRDQTGQQVVSTATWYTAIGNAAAYTPDSRFTDSTGRVSLVIGVNPYTTPSGVEDHVEVYLT